jgi:hypothetical protein
MFSEKINKLNKFLAMVTKRRSENIQINKIRDEKVYSKTNINEIQRLIGEYFKHIVLN